MQGLVPTFTSPDGLVHHYKVMSQAMSDTPGVPWHSFGLVWKTSPNSQTSVSMGPYIDKAQGEGEFAEALVSLGYSRPRWWQYWRWSESVPSERVLRLIEWINPGFK